MQVKTFLERQRERALAYLETLVRHQKQVFTSNSRSAADCLSLKFPSRTPKHIIPNLDSSRENTITKW